MLLLPWDRRTAEAAAGAASPGEVVEGEASPRVAVGAEFPAAGAVAGSWT